MKLHLNRCLGVGKLSDLSSLHTLSALGIGLAILCVSTASTAAIVVRPGGSIQAAVDAASPGETIVVQPGTYYGQSGATEGVRIKKSGIRLIANSDPKKGKKVILVPNPDGANKDGILAEPDAWASALDDIQGFTVQGFTVQGFPNNGIKLEHVNGFKILSNESIDNLENGIQPELSANGLVNRNVSYGSLDSALWVEGGTNVRVIGNVTHSSVTGLEVTISKDVVIQNNESYNNTVGMGLYHPSAASEPPLPVMENWRVKNNYIHDNNLPNPLPPNTSMASTLPPGGGILLMGVSKNEIEHNRVENNGFFGLAIIDFCLAVEGGYDFAGPPWCFANTSGADPVPRDNVIERNTFVHNGTSPPAHPLAPFAADIVYLVPDPAAGNCFDRNTYTTSSFVLGGGPDQCL